MFRASLFIIAKKLKTTQISFEKGMIKLWYIHIMEHYSAIKRHKILIHTKTWIYLQRIKLNEKSQSHEIIYCMIPFM